MVPGWSPIEQLHSLYCMALASAGLGGDLLEIGSWCGRSSVALGLAARATGCRLWCVDLFPERDDWFRNADGSYSMRVRLGDGIRDGYQEQTVWKEPFEREVAPVYERHGGILEAFQRTIERSDLAGTVTAFRGSVEDFLAASPSPRLRLAFIDGDHGYEAVCRDIRNVDGILQDGGWLCFDDAFSSYDGVDRAIRELVLDDPRYEAGSQVTRKLFVARKSRATPAQG